MPRGNATYFLLRRENARAMVMLKREIEDGEMEKIVGIVVMVGCVAGALALIYGAWGVVGLLTDAR